MITQIERTDATTEQVVVEFLKQIGAERLNQDSFKLGDKIWFIDYHPFDHPDDIIIAKDEALKYDNFLLVKTGASRTRIPGWCSQKTLISTPARDIYRNNKSYYMVNDANLKDLSIFNLKNLKLKTEFIINQQTAENLGHKLMISGLLAGVHYFCKQADIYFKDINQKDECFIGDKKVKIYTRDAHSDEDMLIYETYYQKNKDIDIYLTCKIKGGNFNYIGWVDKKLVEQTRIVQMIGTESDKASKDIRRIFAEQYNPVNELIQIYEEDQQQEREIINQKYVPLHVHSEYSIGDGYGSPEYLAKKYYLKGFKAGALTDHGTLGGVYKFQKAMLEHNLKPIIGCEVYIKIPEIEKYAHQLILVKNQIGWINLNKLQNKAARENFYYKPLVLWEDLINNSEGLIVTSSCVDGVINKLIRENKEEIAEAYLLKYQQIFKDDFYGEIQPHTAVNNQEVMQKAFNLFKNNNIKMIFTTDSHYPDKEDKQLHEAIKAINFKKQYGEAGFGDDCFYLMQDDDINQRLETDPNKWLKPYINNLKNNTFEITDKIDFIIKPVEQIDTLPKMAPTMEERKVKLKKLCLEGLNKNTKYEYKDKIKERLDFEVDRILIKDYENYFLMVADLISWCKKNQIKTGPGRGSVGASLAAYALGITDCDPIEYDLLFDRFLSAIRRDAPDVDMDFQDDRRHEVFQYLRDKYGDNHCAKVATYSRFHPKGILRDIGRIFKINISEIEKICSLVIERSGGDARASFGLLDTFAEFEEAKKFQQKYPKAVEIAIKLEGHIRHKGVHAAAMVVSEKPVYHYSPINKLGGEIIVEFEKQEAEDMKLIKLDVLGLKTLSVISDCEQLTKVPTPKSFHHKKVYDEVFSCGKTLGVFQFETVGLGKLSKSLQISDFNTLYDATTLFRPGALHSGQTMQYVNRHQGKEEAIAAHELLKDITKDTKGIILYQEQIMQIMNQIGGMSWATAEMARKVITKSKGKKAFEEMRQEFVRNANKLHNMEVEAAEQLYDVVSTFGSYSFNKSHAVEYSIISYWCAYYKTFFPQEFFCSILKHETDSIKISDYLHDAERLNVKINNPDINCSKQQYSVCDNEIYAGFNSIKGIGGKTSQKIINNQPYKSLSDFDQRAKVSKTVRERLIIAGCFDLFNINKKAEITKTDCEDYTGAELSSLVAEFTDLKPMIKISDSIDFGNYEFVDINKLSEEYGNKTILVRGIVTAVINKDKLLKNDIKKHQIKYEHHMYYLNINDGSGNLAIQINPWTYEKYKNLINTLTNKAVIIYGLTTREGTKVYGEIIEVVGETDDIKTFDQKLKGNNVVILSSTPAVSKNGNSYYRLKLNNQMEGMCFKFDKPLYAGDEVIAEQTQKPFLRIIKLEGK